MNQRTLEHYHSKDNYYSQGEGLSNSEWQGNFAHHQGLEGTIARDQWKQSCQGKTPDGTALRRQQNNSRAGWDLTLSASKSASLKALVDQDSRVLQAHRKAVYATVDYIEKNCIYAQIKDKGILKREQTQQGQFALFEHDDNRNKEPQLHTHIVILNQTLCQDGKSRTLDSRELFNHKKTIGAYYDHTFAYHLIEQGFDIEWTSDHTFEIKGYQSNQIEAFSSRRQQIREHLEQQNLTLEQASEAQKAIACLESRPIKLHQQTPIDREAQRERWQKECIELGIIHPQPYQTLNQILQNTPHLKSLKQIIEDGIESATTYSVAIPRQKLLQECLRHGQAHHSPQAIDQALAQNRNLIQTQDGRITTQKLIDREQYILDTANQTQNTQPPLSTPKTIQQIAQERNLNEGQTQGLTHIATSQDFITLVQGNAGVGKTYTLKALRDSLSQTQRNQLKGLAPSAAAAETLTQEANIESTTVDRYLLTPSNTQPQNQIIIVDEAGMLSCHQMEHLIRKAQNQQSRLILVGDTKQLSAIEAGAPFRLLQSRSDLKTITIEQNLRQRVPHLFDAASLAAQHQTNEALVRLDRHDCIQEIQDPAQRNQRVVEQYLAREPREQAQTLILCDTNQDRRDITTQIRAAYIKTDRLSQDAKTIQILYPKTLDKQAITQAYHYEIGDVIRFQRPSKQFPEHYYRVSEIQENILIVKDRAGHHQELPLEKHKAREIFGCQSLEIREGDRLRFTRNHREHNQINGQPFTIEALNPDSTIRIRTKGQHYTVTSDQLLHTDYAYCRTVYSAQGWTSTEAIWAPSQKPGQEQTYVALTRAKDTLQIFTLNRAALGLSVNISQAQENALDLVPPKLAQNPKLEPAPQQSSQLTDQQLWAAVQAIEQWNKTKPYKPADHLRQGYQDRIESLNQQGLGHAKAIAQLKTELAELERSKLPFNLFDVNRERIEHKQSELIAQQSILSQVKRDYGQEQAGLTRWQTQMDTYHQWEKSEKSQQMHKVAQTLNEPEYQNRLALLKQHRRFHGMAQHFLQTAGTQTEQGWCFEGERYQLQGQDAQLSVIRKVDQTVIYQGLKPETANGMPTILQAKYTQNDWSILEQAVTLLQIQQEQQQPRQRHRPGLSH